MSETFLVSDRELQTSGHASLSGKVWTMTKIPVIRRNTLVRTQQPDEPECGRSSDTQDGWSTTAFLNLWVAKLF